MARKRKLEHGHVDHGRLQLDRDIYEPIRMYLMVKVGEARAALASAVAGAQRYRLPGSDGKIAYWESVVAYLGGILASGTKSVSQDAWASACTHVTTIERHAVGTTRSDQMTIPGM